VDFVSYINNNTDVPFRLNKLCVRSRGFSLRLLPPRCKPKCVIRQQLLDGTALCRLCACVARSSAVPILLLCVYFSHL
jgi:hypothetical protein